eukprot:CAMPEP_0181214132 /NCGR_PEP_ID=MMETSP1096-20121128/25283_1 /TAXON_ID=156174 ORGANISM="Chrysochromulina ericina, Strain CCMP281" /NCGR_SAMPLE_ID=MMETSP1096 /ASSEMBLY_ACC=CAM_ASM_000453 /LENGTH=73 /DNA_ID=CAMNT_0023305833 /DNA_START=305 /DNA_END=522 /DNA_ORIENTATION=-
MSRPRLELHMPAERSTHGNGPFIRDSADGGGGGRAGARRTAALTQPPVEVRELLRCSGRHMVGRGAEMPPRYP